MSRPTRANNKSHCRGQRETNAVELEHGSKLRQPRKIPRCWTNRMKGQYAYEWAYHSRRRTPLAKFLPQHSIKTLRERDLGVGGPRAWLCKSCSKHWAHPRLVGPSRNGTVRQRVRTGKKTACRCPSDPRRGGTSDILRHSGIKPMDNGNARGSRERKQRTTARRQSGESSRNQQDARLHAAVKHASCRRHPDGLRCLRKVGRKGGTSAETTSKKKAGKT